MTDISSRGLLPQLTDVLYALTGSHELLLWKLRDVRLGHHDSMVGSFATFHATPTPVDVSHHGHAIDGEAELCRLEVTDDFHRTVNSSVTDPTAIEHPTPATSVSVPAPQESPTEDSNSAPPPDWFERNTVDDAGSSTSDSESGNYNFFDDLDAELARLRDSESGPGLN